MIQLQSLDGFYNLHFKMEKQIIKTQRTCNPEIPPVPWKPGLSSPDDTGKKGARWPGQPCTGGHEGSGRTLFHLHSGNTNS